MTDTKKYTYKYRGDKYDPMDCYLNMLITQEELRSTPQQFNKIILHLKLTESQIIRTKQLRRRELCKIYSKKTRDKIKNKQSKLKTEMSKEELHFKIETLETSMNTIISEFETFKKTFTL
jgi:hypothetical protein